MCVASDSRPIVVAMLLFVENKEEIGQSLGVSGVTRNYLIQYYYRSTMALILIIIIIRMYLLTNVITMFMIPMQLVLRADYNATSTSTFSVSMF